MSEEEGSRKPGPFTVIDFTQAQDFLTFAARARSIICEAFLGRRREGAVAKRLTR